MSYLATAHVGRQAAGEEILRETLSRFLWVATLVLLPIQAAGSRLGWLADPEPWQSDSA